jgi:hypothetical protein
MFKTLIALSTLIVLSLLYFRNVVKANAVSKLGDKLEKDPDLAMTLSTKLDDLMAEFEIDYNDTYTKLSRLIYELEVSYHRLYKCFPVNSTTFLVITVYEHLNLSNSSSVEKIIPLNYKFVLDKYSNKVKIYTDNLSDQKLTGYKKSFVKEFFRKYLEKTVQL